VLESQKKKQDAALQNLNITRMPEQIVMKLGMYIMPPTGHLIGVVNKAEDDAKTKKLNSVASVLKRTIPTE
jgi:hypothetical protein